MKEIYDIVRSYEKSVYAGKRCALVTVVHVEGSSYRRPGARMLVTDDGMLTGAISGGCLEGDALRKALLAINKGENKLVTYDTTDGEDAKLGVQLGCNGIVHILFEPINNNEANNPLALLKKITAKRRPVVIATLFSLEARDWQPGTCFLYADGQLDANNHKKDSLGKNISPTVLTDISKVFEQETSEITDYGDGLLRGLLQYVPPPISLVVVGAGNDTIPLVSIANILGWQTTLLDGRPTHANAARFPLANKIIVATSENALQQLEIDGTTACVLMTHNYNYDLALLKKLLDTDICYIGVLGPKAKMERMYADMEAESIVISDKKNIFSPVGLDIGAETCEEIALSITAEIKSVMMAKDAQMLRYKLEPVHG